MNVKAKQVIDWKVIGEPLDQILQAVENKIERDWPKTLSTYGGSQEMVLFTMKVAKNTYMSIRWICADKPSYEDRKLKYSASVPPLVRTIVDQIFTLVFVSEDVINRSQWYYKSGWRELKEEFDRCKSKYAGNSDWTEWLKSFQEKLELSKKSWGISEAEANNPKKIEWWPNPSKILQGDFIKKHPFKDPETIKFLEFLRDWFYRKLSAASHSTLPGLIEAGNQLIKDESDDKQRESLLDFKSECLTTSVTLLLVLISEIEAMARFGLEGKISYIWGILIQYWGDAKELYDIRYAKLLIKKNDQSTPEIR